MTRSDSTGDNFQDHINQSGSITRPTNDDRDQKSESVILKPTLLLQNMPLEWSEEDVRDLIPSKVTVETVRMFEFITDDGNLDHRTAVICVSTSTPISEVDKAIMVLQNKYLGFGHYLKAARHVSSSGDLSNIDETTLALPFKHPFGAVEVDTPVISRSLKDRSPDDRIGTVRRLAVVVQTPTDLGTLKMIHDMTESVYEEGPEYESLVMNEPDVQTDEDFAWLWDISTPEGVYYRWCLFSLKWGYDQDPVDWVEFFAGQPPWIPPTPPKFFSVERFEDIVDHSDYESVDSDDPDGANAPRNSAFAPPGQDTINDDAPLMTDVEEQRYLGVLKRAELVHYLSSLPKSTGSLTSGEVACITFFCVQHAATAADEITDLLLTNLEYPFNYTVHYGSTAGSDADSDGEDHNGLLDNKEDRSNSQLIALYLVSDLLMNASTSGAREAWRFRTLFESSLLSRRCFQRLRNLERIYKWGRIKAEQWRRKIESVFEIWTSASVFSNDSLDTMRETFLAAPFIGADTESEHQGNEDWRDDRPEEMRWKSVSGAATTDDQQVDIVEDQQARNDDVTRDTAMTNTIPGETSNGNREAGDSRMGDAYDPSKPTSTVADAAQPLADARPPGSSISFSITSTTPVQKASQTGSGITFSLTGTPTVQRAAPAPKRPTKPSNVFDSDDDD